MVLHNSASPNMVHRLSAKNFLGYLVKMHIAELYPRLTEPESLWVELGSLHFYQMLQVSEIQEGSRTAKDYVQRDPLQIFYWLCLSGTNLRWEGFRFFPFHLTSFLDSVFPHNHRYGYFYSVPFVRNTLKTLFVLGKKYNPKGYNL